MFNAMFNAIGKLVRQYPRSIGIPLALFTADRYLRYRAYRLKTVPIDNIMKEGTKPPLPPEVSKSTIYIDRSEIVGSIMDKFISSQATGDFGIVLGPTGTRKTYVAREACNTKPAGVLYCEVTLSETLGENLAEIIGMPLGPTGVVDLVLAYISEGYRHYYQLPHDNIKAIEFILSNLEKRAVKYKKHYGHIPCLFIDGIDLLAKHDSCAFVTLVELAKVYANRNSLRIIFVSSEGQIIPLMKTTSSNSRAACIMEVLNKVMMMQKHT